MFKRIVFVLIGLVLLAQFIQPDRSVPSTDPAKDILVMKHAPTDIQKMVIGNCYDCHSHRSTYPWYAYITPMNFIVQDHINEGREHLNFSRWPEFADSEEAGETAEVLQENDMPPGYYQFMHAHGRLSGTERAELIAWFKTNIPGGEEGSAVRSAGEEENEPE